MRDPLVMRVKELVDGTIVNIRPAHPMEGKTAPPPPESDDAEELTTTE